MAERILVIEDEPTLARLLSYNLMQEGYETTVEGHGSDGLQAALRHVRPGGVVAYVTCSPHLSETVGIVSAVLRRERDVEQLDARTYLPGVPRLGDGPSVQLWPHRHGTDAMFLALLRRPA